MASIIERGGLNKTFLHDASLFREIIALQDIVEGLDRVITDERNLPEPRAFEHRGGSPRVKFTAEQLDPQANNVGPPAGSNDSVPEYQTAASDRFQSRTKLLRSIA